MVETTVYIKCSIENKRGMKKNILLKKWSSRKQTQIKYTAQKAVILVGSLYG